MSFWDPCWAGLSTGWGKTKYRAGLGDTVAGVKEATNSLVDTHKKALRIHRGGHRDVIW